MRNVHFIFTLLLLLSCSLFRVTSAGAQTMLRVPFGFTSEDDNKLVREDDSFRYFIATGDTSHVIGINDEQFTYKVFNRDRKVIAEGSFLVDHDKYLQNGKCTAYYSTGRMKVTGSYRRGTPIGTWEEYYPSGKMKMIGNFGFLVDDYGGSFCMSGSCQEFYQDGKLKLSGFYGVSLYTISDTVSVTDPVTEVSVIKIATHNGLKAVKTGHWEYYTENGDLEKKEDF